MECLSGCLSVRLCLQTGAFPPQVQVPWEKGFISVQKKGQFHLHQTFAEKVWLQLWGDLVKL